jgi:hypothetical protein
MGHGQDERDEGDEESFFTLRNGLWWIMDLV